MNIFMQIFLPLIILTGQSNMVHIADDIALQMPGYFVLDCSKRSTDVLEWQINQPLFDDCVSRAMALIDNGYTPVALMHFQGEADADNFETASQWDVLAKRYFDDFRQSIGYPDLLVIYAQIGSKPTGKTPRPYWGMVQIRQGDLVRERYANIKMIRTRDVIPYCPQNGVHWCEPGQAEIAERFVSKYFQFTPVVTVRALVICL